MEKGQQVEEAVPKEAVDAVAKAAFRLCAEWVGGDAKNASWGHEGKPAGREYWRGLVAPLLAEPNQLNPMGFVRAALYEDWASRLLGEGIEAATKVVGPVFDRGGGEIYRREIADACVRAALSSIAEPDSGGGAD